jgi:hypothetical protein
MSNINRSKLALRVTTLLMAIFLAMSLGVLTIRPQVAHATAQSTSASKSNGHPVCAANGKSIELSQGGQMFCKGPSPMAYHHRRERAQPALRLTLRLVRTSMQPLYRRM